MGAQLIDNISESDCTQTGAITNMIQITHKKNITGENIKRIRQQKGLSQLDIERISSLAGRDMTRSKLAKIESGMIRVTDEILRDLAITLEVNVSLFFD